MRFIFLERYPRLFMKVTPEFPIHFLKIYRSFSIITSEPASSRVIGDWSASTSRVRVSTRILTHQPADCILR
jgi:hypothetical protein